MIPAYNTTGGTRSWVDDGSPLGDLAWLNYNNVDEANAEDRTDVYITMANNGSGLDTRIDIYLECEVYSHSDTQNAPGNTGSGSYFAGSMAYFYSNMALGTWTFDHIAYTEISSNATGPESNSSTGILSDESDPIEPRQTWFESGSGISTAFWYTTTSHGILKAQRPEVSVGTEAGCGHVDGVIIGWDFSDPLNPVVAVDSNSNPAIWLLE